jgi:hypothetical protein
VSFSSPKSGAGVGLSVSRGDGNVGDGHLIAEVPAHSVHAVALWSQNRIPPKFGGRNDGLPVGAAAAIHAGRSSGAAAVAARSRRLG